MSESFDGIVCRGAPETAKQRQGCSTHNFLDSSGGCRPITGAKFLCLLQQPNIVPTNRLAEIIASGEGAGLEIMSNLFGCPPEILGDAIVTKSISVGGKTIKSRVNCAEAEFARDALAKGIYGRLFDWLVRKLNKSTIQVDRPKTFLGILDIYGFENLEPNGFEQLFINYANEKLQDLFNTHIFHLEEAEYRKEKIEFSSKDFPSNKACLALIEKPPMGIMSLMDEECLMGKGSDASLARKIHKRYGKAGSGGRVRAAVRKRSQPKIPVGAEDKQGNGTAAITGSKEKKQPVPSDYFEACGGFIETVLMFSLLVALTCMCVCIAHFYLFANDCVRVQDRPQSGGVETKTLSSSTTLETLCTRVTALLRRIRTPCVRR